MKVNCAHQELVLISELKLNPDNRNVHPKDQIERLASILKYQGWRYPVKVSVQSGMVVSGHGRIEAALLNGWTFAPVDRQEYDSPEQEFADSVADNAIASWAELDLSGIQLDVKGLSTEFDIQYLGMKEFSVIDSEKLDPGCDEDEIPEKVEPKTKLGDLYQLGNHRLLCGDSTSIDAVEKLMNGEKADITFTSPPYNAGCFGYDGGKDKYKGKSDNKNQDDYFDLLIGFTNIALDISTYVFFNNQFLSGNRHALAKFFGHYSDYVKDVFPWIKNTAPPNINPGVFTNRFEFFLCLEKGCSKKDFPVDWQGKYNNVIEGHTAAKDNVSKGTHSATMPIYVPEWFLERLPFVKTVYEPFGGSGTTLIACEKTNRKCFMSELDPHYCDVIISRWEKYSGKKAELIHG